uniref:Lysosomal aspartic protease n=2 Tax=Lygus hesperus TaxID=30085 RepID=A0A146LCT1_LYGHE
MTFFSSFIICAVFACCYVSADKILSIPLKMKDSPLTAMLKQSVHPNVITAILKAEAKGHFPLPLKYNYMRNEYFTEIHLGQPGQKFIVSFDTTWLDSWVPSSSCSFSSVQCMIRNQYNENKSRTSIKTPYNFHVTLGNSDLAGNIFNDLLNINGVNVTSQSFAAVSEIPWLFVYSSFDGIFGMGLDHYDKIVPVMWNLKKQKIIDQLVFSFHFKGDEGSMVLGGVDSAHYEGNFTYFNVVNSDPPQWMVRVDDMTLTRSKNETIKVCKSGCNAVMSTGGSQIYGPSKDIAAINSFIKAKDLRYTGHQRILRQSTVS